MAFPPWVSILDAAGRVRNVPTARCALDMTLVGKRSFHNGKHHGKRVACGDEQSGWHDLDPHGEEARLRRLEP
jgi:hypothetical protein